MEAKPNHPQTHTTKRKFESRKNFERKRKKEKRIDIKYDRVHKLLFLRALIMIRKMFNFFNVSNK
jgi:hypothetical protein